MYIKAFYCLVKVAAQIKTQARCRANDLHRVPSVAVNLLTGLECQLKRGLKPNLSAAAPG